MDVGVARVLMWRGDQWLPMACPTVPDAGLNDLAAACLLFAQPPPDEVASMARDLLPLGLRIADEITRPVLEGRESTPLVDISPRVRSETKAAITSLTPEGPLGQQAPLRQLRDQVLVVQPALLAPAIRTIALRTIVSAGWADECERRLRQLAQERTVLACRRLGWQMTDVGVHGPEEVPVESRLWTFDDDGLAIVTVLAEDLRDASIQRVDEPWRADVHREAISMWAREVISTRMEGEPSAGKVLHLIVVAAGRPARWTTAEMDVARAHEVTYSLSDLEFVSRSESHDPLALWRYRSDVRRLRAQVLANDSLDLFAIWRANDRSFYLTDGPRPSLITAGGAGRALRDEIEQNWERHGVQGPGGRGYIEVERRFEDLPVPIFRPTRVSLDALVVELGESIVWVLDETGGLPDLVDTAAYWTWRVLQHVDLDGYEVGVQHGESTTVVLDREGRLMVSVNPSEPELAVAENCTERRLVQQILKLTVGDDALLDEIAPLGYRRMLVISDFDDEPALYAPGLPSSRPVLRDSDDAQAMDERGDHLWSKYDVPIGELGPDLRSKLLWAAIEFHAAQLTELIATLSPVGLLERLLALHERLLNRGALVRRMTPTRHACFGDVADVSSQIADELEQLGKEGPALRFVVEAVAARPPGGEREITTEVVDRLVAIASQVHSVGGVSEAIRTGLEDVRVSRLESGRMGVDRRGAYFGTNDAYRDQFIHGDRRRAERAFAIHGSDPGPSGVSDADAERLRTAGRAEFGQELDVVFNALEVLADLAGERAAAAVPLHAASEALAAEIELETSVAEFLIRRLALAPRSSPVFAAPEGFEPGDIYPWRFARRLSLLQRPIVIRPGKGGDEAVLAPRLLRSVGRHWLADMRINRFRAASPELKHAMTLISQRADERFNDELADRLSARPGFLVEKRVTDVGSLRLVRSDGNTLGDIDVLAADSAHNCLYVLDAKNLALARTPIEVANEIRNSFADRSRDRPGKARIHRERIDWVQDHLNETLAYLGLTDNQPWSVRGALVTNVEARGPLVQDLPVDVISIGNLDGWICGA